jgi:hypothetical protein
LGLRHCISVTLAKEIKKSKINDKCKTEINKDMIGKLVREKHVKKEKRK